MYRITQHVNHERRKERVGMRLERRWLLGGNLLTSLSIALGYPLTACSIGEKAQQAYRRASVEELRKRAEEHCGKGVPKEIWLFNLGWMTEEVVVSYLVCIRCGEQGCHVEDNQGQRVILRRRLEQLNWCGCQKRKEKGATWS